jgi:ATP-dependent DNA helicase RecG
MPTELPTTITTGPTPDSDWLDTVMGQVESNNLEFKAASSGFDKTKAVEYCVALANEGGGYLILGVSDSMPRTVGGSQAFQNTMELERFIFDALQIKVLIREVTHSAKRVLVFVIPKRRQGQPLHYQGRYLMRAGESLVPMPPHQLASIFDEANGGVMAKLVAVDLTSDEVMDLVDLRTFYDKMPWATPAAPADLMANAVVRGLLRADSPDTYSIPLQTAVLMAKDLAQFPGLELRRVRVLVYSGTSRLHATFEHFETRGYVLAFEDLIRLLRGHMPMEEQIVGGDGIRVSKPIYPPTAVREFLANALIHQDFDELSSQLVIEIFPNRIEIKNPGQPMIDVQRFVDETRSRNPELAELMRLAGICEARGSGVDRALTEIEDYLRPAPAFRAENGATTISLFASQDFAAMTVEERVWSAFLHCCLRYAAGDRLTNTSLRERFGVGTNKTAVVSQTIAAAVAGGLIQPDPRAGSSRRNAAYVPFFVIGSGTAEAQLRARG